VTRDEATDEHDALCCVIVESATLAPGTGLPRTLACLTNTGSFIYRYSYFGLCCTVSLRWAVAGTALETECLVMMASGVETEFGLKLFDQDPQLA